MTPTGPIVGTAGHVDHGKTALVRALTGTHLDALPEERERGITIALGFTHTTVGERRFAVIDVPGHESLVRTMVAGVAGMDAVMLCISAVDGVMPQTREHLGICHALGLTQGVVVLTMADRVDAELLELAEAEASELVEGTFLHSAPIVATSSVTEEGLPALREALSQLTTVPRPGDAPFRLPIDRVFHRDGFGTIATGTAWAGRIGTSDAVSVWPAGHRLRVRGLHVHGEATDAVQAGLRVAVNLTGPEATSLSRGDVLATGPIACTHQLDAQLSGFADAPELEDGAPIRVLLGTSEALGRVHFTGEVASLAPRGGTTAQLRLDSAIPCVPGDRFIVRRPSPEDTLAGGVVLDPWAPRMRQRDRTRAASELDRLIRGDHLVLLERAGETGLSAADATARQVGDLALTLADRAYAPSIVGRLEGRLLDALNSYHHDNPLSLGAHRRELHRGGLAHLPDRGFDALVDRLVQMGMAETAGPLVRLNGFAVALSTEQQSQRQAIVDTIRATGLEGLKRSDLHETHPDAQTTSLVQLLAADDVVVDVSGLGWLARDVLDALVRDVRSWFTEHDGLDAQQFKAMTGLSRRAAIPLLEWLDAERVTRRDTGLRRLHPDARRSSS